jgi:hypothetical protein
VATQELIGRLSLGTLVSGFFALLSCRIFLCCSLVLSLLFFVYSFAVASFVACLLLSASGELLLILIQSTRDPHTSI